MIRTHDDILDWIAANPKSPIALAWIPMLNSNYAVGDFMVKLADMVDAGKITMNDLERMYIVDD